MRPSVFQAAEVGPLFERFSLGPPFEEFQKMADFGVFAKFARTRLCSAFLGAVCVKMFSDDCTLNQYQLKDLQICVGVVFEPPSSAHFLNDFPLVPPLKNFKQWPILVSLLNLLELGFPELSEAPFASKCSPMIAL